MQSIGAEQLVSPVWTRYTPIVAERAQGAYIYDRETGRRYLDFTTGLILYGGALTLFAHLLRRAELAVIFALWVGVADVLITVLGWLVFNEPLSPRRLLGLGLILTGVVLLEV